MKCFFEVILASSEGLAYRVKSSRIQDSFWIQAHWRQPTCISASLQSQKTTGFTFRLCFASPFEEWVVSWQYFCLLSNPFTTLLFHLLLFSTATKKWSCSERNDQWQKKKERMQKTEQRGKWKMKMGGSWERRYRQTRENIFFNWDTDSPVNFV